MGEVKIYQPTARGVDQPQEFFKQYGDGSKEYRNNLEPSHLYSADVEQGNHEEGSV